MNYTLLHGAKKNAGDFLIRDRALELITNITGVCADDILGLDLVRKTLSKTQFESIEKSDAVILAGGPAYQPDFDQIYPSLDTILDSGVPIYPLGPGWKGTNEEEYTFTEGSMDLLRRIHDQIEFSGVRDLPTKRVLNAHGIDNVELAGCPAWYDLGYIGDSFEKPSTISSLVISTVVPSSRHYRKQFRYLLRRVAEEYPKADLYCSFHRGLYSDEHTPWLRSIHLRRFKRVAENNGYSTLNPAYEIEKLETYRDIDVHIGYRVHGHIYFLAQRHPSYLLQVDGRGTGVSESLSTPGDVPVFDQPSYNEPVDKVLKNVQRDAEEGFTNFDGVGKRIDDTYKTMQRLIQSM